MCDCFQDSPRATIGLCHQTPSLFSHMSATPASSRKSGIVVMWPPTWVKVRLQLKVALFEELRLTLSSFRLKLESRAGVTGKVWPRTAANSLAVWLVDVDVKDEVEVDVESEFAAEVEVGLSSSSG